MYIHTYPIMAYICAWVHTYIVRERNRNPGRKDEGAVAKERRREARDQKENEISRLRGDYKRATAHAVGHYKASNRMSNTRKPTRLPFHPRRRTTPKLPELNLAGHTDVLELAASPILDEDQAVAAGLTPPATASPKRG